MLPIPTHLSEILIPCGKENNESSVNGVIRCSCGSKTFRIDSNNDTYADDEYSFVIKAICSGCAKAYLIFDSKKHGWDGFVCHGEWIGESAPDKVLTPHLCLKCKGDAHVIELGISSQGKNDFIEESGISDGDSVFKEEDWVNAFDWITVSLTCSVCGGKEKNWIDLETM